MPTKKELTISAFENLDFEMLEVLLNDGHAYQDVPKDVFVKELRRYFSEIKKFDDTKFDFKAHKGVCTKCNKGKTGFSFINSDNECMMSLIFEENEDDFTDIYKCSSFQTFDKNVDDEWTGIYFYEEDNINYSPSAKNTQDEKLAIQAVTEIENEIETEVVLSADFCINWYHQYEQLDDWGEIIKGKIYKYKKQVKAYLFNLSFIVSMMENDSLACRYLEEFVKFPLITEKKIKDWLIRCDHDLHNFIYGFHYTSNFRSSYFENADLKFDLQSIYYIQNLSEILNKYFDWIPNPNPITEKERENLIYDDDSDYPF